MTVLWMRYDPLGTEQCRAALPIEHEAYAYVRCTLREGHDGEHTWAHPDLRENLDSGRTG